MAESAKSDLEYRKVSAMFAPPLSVVREDRLWMTSNALLRLARPQASRFLFILSAYALVLSSSLWLAYQLRFDFDVPPAQAVRMYSLMAWIIPMKIAILFFIAELDGLLSYFSIPDLERLFLSLAISLFILAALWWTSEGALAPPRGVMVADLIVSFLALSGTRLFFRMARERFASPAQPLSDRLERVGIIGAGDMGASLALELFTKRHLGLEPVAFFDDDSAKWGARIHNISVIGGPECLLREKATLKLDKIILAIPSTHQRRFREIVALLKKIEIPFESVPAFEQLATGRVKITQLRSIQPDDLFGRSEVNLDLDRIRQTIEGRAVLVTGAGGSIGAELCRRIASFAPRQLLLLDQCEVHLFQIEQELAQAGHQEIVVPLVADILDPARMRLLFQRHRPDLVFHAAAHRHSDVLEQDPSAAIQTNVFGAVRMGELAIEFGVDRFVLLSSDRATQAPTVMGISKRLAEAAVQALFARHEKRESLTIVRFAELADTAGGVLQRFNKEIAAGGPVRISHPASACYSMTTAQAAGLVLQCTLLKTHDAIFALDIGRPIKLIDLACKAIEFCGLMPDRDIEIVFTGGGSSPITSGEDISRPSSLSASEHPKILRCQSPHRSWESMEPWLKAGTENLTRLEPAELKRWLNEAVSEPEVEPALWETECDHPMQTPAAVVGG